MTGGRADILIEKMTGGQADILIEKHTLKDGQTDQKTSWQQSRSWDKLPYIHIDKHPITYHQTINL